MFARKFQAELRARPGTQPLVVAPTPAGNNKSRAAQTLAIGAKKRMLFRMHAKSIGAVHDRMIPTPGKNSAAVGKNCRNLDFACGAGTQGHCQLTGRKPRIQFSPPFFDFPNWRNYIINFCKMQMWDLT